MKKYRIYIGTLLLLLLLPVGTNAAAVVRSGEAVSVAHDQTIEGDFYAAGNTISLSGTALQDVTLVGSRALVEGPVGGDALVLAGSVDIKNTVADDLRIVGGEVVISAPVTGNVLVVAGSVHVLPTATIGGDLLLYTGEAVIEGAVSGSVLGANGTVRVDASVTGGVDMAVERLILGDRANIGGDVHYRSHGVLTQALNATVSGEIVHDSVVSKEDENNNGVAEALVPALVIVFASLIWVLWSRWTLGLVTNRATEFRLRSGILGVIILFGVPLVGTIFLFTVIGMLAGTIILSAYLSLLVLAIAALPAVLGRWVMRFWDRDSSPGTTQVLIGGLVITLGLAAPSLGILLLMVVHCIVLGAITDVIVLALRKV